MINRERVVTLVFDSFKGSIGATELGGFLRDLLRPEFPGLDIANFPASDGGDGFAESVGFHFRAQRVECAASDPLMRPRAAHYIWSPNDRLAILESAQANGLALLAGHELDPLRTTTYGVGELLLDAARRGAGRIIVGVGGSATVDGGVGMAQALGFTFADSAGQLLGPHISEFGDVSQISAPAEHPLTDVRISVACDVRTRLLGPRAVSAVWIYGPQKGGTEESLSLIERHLTQLDGLVRSELGGKYGEMEMGGAAGGLAAGLAVFAGAKLRRGMELFDELTGLRQQIERSSLVITGEGRLDEQSAEGKVVSYVSDLARSSGIPVVAVCGSVGAHAIALDDVLALTDSGMPAAACIARPLDALAAALPRLVETIRGTM